MLINKLVESGKQFTFMEYPNRTDAISEGRHSRSSFQPAVPLPRGKPSAFAKRSMAFLREVILMPGT
jgi:hypothetical protein